MSVICGIYFLRFINLGSFYIGSTDDINRRKIEHIGLLEKGCHYNPKVQEAYFQDSNISFDFIPIENRNIAFEKEQELLDINSNNPALLNCNLKVQIRSAETNLKISSSLMDHHVSEETKLKLGESKKDNKFWLGRTHTEESKLKMSISQKGNSNAKGHAKTPGGIERHRQQMIGRTLSEETKLKVSINSAKAKSVTINGNNYRNMTEAGRSLGISSDTIRRRILSEDNAWSDYSFMEKK